MTYCIDQFQGLIPRLDEASMPGNAALVARDVDLSHGRIDPWRMPKIVANLGETTCSAHVLDCCWKGFCDPCDMFVTARPCQDVYISNPCYCPHVLRNWCEDGEAVPLGLPEPAAPEIVSHSAVVEDTEFTELRTFVTTYCGPCGQEGAPSKPSGQIKADKNTEVTVKVCPPLDEKYEVTHVNVYASRSSHDVSTGYKGEDPSAISAGVYAVDGSAVDYFLIGSAAIGNVCIELDLQPGSIQDSTGASLVTDGFLPPREGLVIFGETNRGSLVGGVGNNIYFSERNAHWAWPTRNCITLNCKFRAGCVIGDSVLIMTDGMPYLIVDDADGSYDGPACRTVREMPVSYPLVSSKSLVCTNTGAVFASTQGLVRFTSDGAIDLISLTHFTPDDWCQLDPASIRAAEYNGSYFFSSTKFSGVFDLNLRGYSAPGNQNLSELCIRPDCWLNDKQGNLFFLQAGKVYQWNAAAEYMPYDYKSAVTRLPQSSSFTAAEIEYSSISKIETLCDPSNISICSDGRERCARPVKHKCPIRISIDNACDIQVGVCGTRSIRRICIATDTTTLGITQ